MVVVPFALYYIRFAKKWHKTVLNTQRLLVPPPTFTAGVVQYEVQEGVSNLEKKLTR